MDLVITRMALSTDQWFSLNQFEENLFKERDHPCLERLDTSGLLFQNLADSTIGIDTDLAVLDLSSEEVISTIMPELVKEAGSLHKLESAGDSLIENLGKAAEWIGANSKRQVLLWESFPSGSAFIVIAHPEYVDSAYTRFFTIGDYNSVIEKVDYVEFSGNQQLVSAGLETKLRELFIEKPINQPVAIAALNIEYGLNSDLLSFIRVVLSVHQNLIPSSIQKVTETFNFDPSELLYANLEPRPWLSRGLDFQRTALLVDIKKQTNEVNFLFLEEIDHDDQSFSIRSVAEFDPYLLPISGRDQETLLNNLNRLETFLDDTNSLEKAQDYVYAKLFQEDVPLHCSLLAKDSQELLKELNHAKSGVLKAFQSGGNWSSPNGSYFTPNPLGSGKIAFVYPGAFNSYPGMGRDLFFSFPGLHTKIKEIIPNPSHSLAEEFIYLRSSHSDPGSSDDQIMLDFYNNPIQLIESGISLSAIHTLILDEIFNIRPQIVFGYSLGEISMLWANQVWQDAESSSQAWNESNLFKTDLVGEMKAVRDYWKTETLGDDFWRSYILKADRKLVDIACNKEPLVFLSIENTPNEVVIVGEVQACQRVIQDLECRALPMPFNAVIHNPTMESCLPAFTKLFSNHTHPQADINFISAANYQPLTITEKDLANEMARMICNPVNFTRLVETAYDAGARTFIEVGPLKTCSRWIERILSGKPHAVIPVNKRHQNDLHGLLKVASLLVSHGRQVNHAELYRKSDRHHGKLSPDLQSTPTLVQSAKLEEKRNVGESDLDIHVPVENTLSANLYENLERISSDMTKSHQAFLDNQQTLTRNLAKIMLLQADSNQAIIDQKPNGKVLFDREQIQAFTIGDHRECFGNTFSGFKNRRIPRLPNGDLQFIDRVIDLQGDPEQIKIGSSLTSEYDFPDRSWYRNGNQSLPFVALMEIALQPCGFLSAYMGSIKGREDQDLYFRNLDGEGNFLAWPKKPTGVIKTHVKLLSSNSLEDVIIQNYEYSVVWGGTKVFQGTSSFGYFPLPMLKNQSGLDGNQTIPPWYENNQALGDWHRDQAGITSKSNPKNAHIPEIGELWISPQGGDFAQGYVYLKQTIPPESWFYKAHFFQDPVMPGSLGVETMARALMLGAQSLGVPAQHWQIKEGSKFKWKYRGQITPDINAFEIDLHIKHITKTSRGWEICADGSLWKNSMRIYQVDNLTLQTYKED
jgi:PfaB family protein